MTPPLDLLVHRLAAAFPNRTIVAILPQIPALAPPQGPISPPEQMPPAPSSPSSPAGSPQSGSESVTGPVALARPRRTRQTLAEKAQVVYEDDRSTSLSREEWVERLGPGTGRLIDRVFRHAPVEPTERGEGKNHRQQLVLASEMASVLRTIESVKAGSMAPPDWYEAVTRVTGVDRAA